MLRVLVYSAVIGIFAFALGVAALSAWRSWQHQQQQAEQKQTAEKATPNSRQSATRVVTEEGPEQAIARYNLWLMIFTGLLAAVGITQIGFLINADQNASESAAAAKRSADTARDTLIATERPWIWPEIVASSDFVFKEDRSATLSIRYTLENMGNTPALSVWPGTKFFPFFWGKVEGNPPNIAKIVPQIMVSKDLRDWCQGEALHSEQLAKADWVQGEPLFPGKTLPGGINNLSMAAGSTENRTQMSNGAVVPVLYFCATYRFPADEKSHYTGRAFLVMRADPKSPGGAREPNPAEGNIPAAEVRLIPQPFGSGSAN